MKKICFFLFLFCSVSCNSANSEFRLQNSRPVKWGNNCITTQDCFYISSDSNLFFLTMYYLYGNENKQFIDSIEIDGYGSTLYSFKSEKNNSYVVLWKIEHEYSPTFKAYYLVNGNLVKIGYWGIFTPCDNCDTQDYPIEYIRIFQRDDTIEISFLKDAEFIDYSENSYNEKWTLYKAGTLAHSFNIDNPPKP